MEERNKHVKILGAFPLQFSLFFVVAVKNKDYKRGGHNNSFSKDFFLLLSTSAAAASVVFLLLLPEVDPGLGGVVVLYQMRRLENFLQKFLKNLFDSLGRLRARLQEYHTLCPRPLLRPLTFHDSLLVDFVTDQ